MKPSTDKSGSVRRGTASRRAKQNSQIAQIERVGVWSVRVLLVCGGIIGCVKPNPLMLAWCSLLFLLLLFYDL